MMSFHSYSYFLLIGNEYLHDIMMTNLQNTLSRTNSGPFTAFTALPGLFVKDLNSDAQGQFILKPRDSARSQQQSESSTFPQQQSQFPFQWGIKYQCMLSFSCLREGHCRKQTQNKTICTRSSWDLYILISRLSLIIGRTFHLFQRDSQHKLLCQDTICTQVCVHTSFFPLEYNFT